MRRLALTTIIALVAACAAAAPPASDSPGERTPSPGATAAEAVTVGDWTVRCDGVAPDDCRGIAALFVNNLAWSGTTVQRDSGGSLSVTPRPDCPAVPAYIDARTCWQATASRPGGPVCMVIARQLDPAKVGSDFGQVGGDDMAGRLLGPPSTWQPCR